MAWLAVDGNSDVYIYIEKTKRNKEIECWVSDEDSMKLDYDADIILLRRVLTWEDEPVEI